MKGIKNIKLGFIGQGWIGKNYADSFESRGFDVTRYSEEEPYVKNAQQIVDCDIVFIAVPTPTTPQGFDSGIVRNVIKLVGKGKIAVIKSTVIPGTTASIQKDNPGVVVLNSPEFLSVATARHDADHPMRNIVGMPQRDSAHQQAAQLVMSILPEAPYSAICSSEEAELIKYGANVFFYVKIVYMNMLHDLASKHGADWSVLKEAFVNNPWMGTMHSDPVHKSGRGAGGGCFIKDFAAFKEAFESEFGRDSKYSAFLESVEKTNIDLLVSTGKDLDILKAVYGTDKPMR